MPRPRPTKKPERIFFALRVAAVIIAIASGAMQLASSLKAPKVVYSTKDLDTYPLTLNPSGELGPPDFETTVLVGPPIKILGLVIQNKGTKSATDVLVRIPYIDSDGLVGGWIARGDRPITNSMQSEVREFKYDKLVPEESVSFYMYLNNTSSTLASRIQVVDGNGRSATYMPYVPMRADGRRLLFSVPVWWVFALATILALLSIPDALSALDRLRVWLQKK